MIIISFVEWNCVVCVCVCIKKKVKYNETEILDFFFISFVFKLEIKR